MSSASAHDKQSVPILSATPTPTPDPSGGHPRRLRKVLAGGIIGTAVEYYDFGLYGYMATVLAALFFQTDDPTAGLLKTLATFAVAFFLRVPGGILFGHIGDRYGRKRALSMTILLMCVATLAIGLLPTYVTIGVWATITLVFLRCLQGLAAGGELGGAAAFVAESAPPKNRARYTASVNVGSNVALLLASLAALAINTLFTSEQVLSGAWRIPFVLSLPLAFVGIWIRAKLDDTPEFRKLDSSQGTSKVPLAELIRSDKKTVARIACLMGMIAGGFYVTFTYGAIYMQTVGGHNPKLSFTSTCIALVIASVVMLASGELADRVGRRPVFIGASLAGIVVAVPCLALMSGDAVLPAVVAHSVLGVPVAMSVGPAFASFAEMLSARVRYSGIALGTNSAQTLLGGTAPFICTWLVSTTGMSLAPAGYFIACSALVGIGTIGLRETAGHALPR